MVVIIVVCELSINILKSVLNNVKPLAYDIDFLGA